MADESGVGLSVILMQVGDRMLVLKNEAPDNAALWSIAFASNSLTNTETPYSSIEKESIDI